MSAAVDILKSARNYGVEITAEGGRLKLRAPIQPPDELVARIRSHKAEVAALVRRENEDWSAEDWRAFFDERAGIAEFDGGETRPQAEARALECCVVEWVNRHPQQSHPGRCAWCGKSENGGHTVVPFGTDGYGQTWLHPECWNDWHESRRDQARQELALLGIGAPSLG